MTQQTVLAWWDFLAFLPCYSSFTQLLVLYTHHTTPHHITTSYL